MIHDSGGLVHDRESVNEMELDRAVFRHTVTAEGRITFKPATHEHEQLPRERVTATVLQKKFDILGCRA